MHHAERVRLGVYCITDFKCESQLFVCPKFINLAINKSWGRMASLDFWKYNIVVISLIRYIKCLSQVKEYEKLNIDLHAFLVRDR